MNQAPDDSHWIPSTGYSDGSFYLVVPNPPSDGNYTCRLTHLTSHCVPFDFYLKQESAVTVDQVSFRFDASTIMRLQGLTRKKHNTRNATE
jgi:hypothetical protein